MQLSPPDSYWGDTTPEPAPPSWHFLSEDGHEDWALESDELQHLFWLYTDAAVPFSVRAA